MSWLVSALVKPILDWLWGKLSAAIALYKKDQVAHQAQVDQAAQDSQKAKELKPDSTEGATDAAIDDELNHL